MKNNDLAIVVVGFDGYSDLWDDFFGLINNYWKDCPFNIYLISNTKKYTKNNVKTFTTIPDAEWSLKVRTAINSIEEEYFLLLLEDFFFSSPVNNQEINSIVNFIVENNIQYVKLPYKGQYNKFKRKKYKNENQYFAIYQDEKYCISLLPGIWNKNFLKEKVGDGNYRPWKFEVDRNKESLFCQHQIFEKCCELRTNPFHILNGVVQGNFLPTTFLQLKKKNWTLNTNSFAIMSWKKYLYFRIKTIGVIYLPQKIQKPIKLILKKFNFKFVSDTKGE